MRYALIDLGSNTIKMEVFDVDNKNFKSVYYDATYSYVVGFVENRILSDEGVQSIIFALDKYKKIAKSMVCDKIICFSTASLRYIDNIIEVVEKVKLNTDITITPISGEEEAFFNFLSLRHNVRKDKFLGADLGGGSLQILVSDTSISEKPLFCKSFPVGSLKMKRDFVENDLPNPSELHDIGEFVSENCSELGQFLGKHKNLHFMGGSMRLICSILGKKLSEDKKSLTEFSVNSLDNLLCEFSDDQTLAKEFICSIAPQRLTSIMPAMKVISQISAIMGVEDIILTQSSVREGFIISYED